MAAFSGDRSGIIGWVDAAPPGAMGEGAGATKALARWGALLLGLGAIAYALGTVIGI